MADTPRDVGSEPPKAPRWVKVSVLIAVVLAVLAILLLTGVFGGGHGPRRHIPPGDGDHTPRPSVTGEHTPPGGFGGHTPPEGT